MRQAEYTRADFKHSPYVVFYELTQACDLVCRHCRACAQPLAHGDELSTDQARALVEQLARFPRRPMLVLTGGDPMKRADVLEVVRHAVASGLEVAVTPSATPLVTADAVGGLRDAGVSRLAVSLDGVDAQTHDSFRGVSGSYRRTLEIMADARAAGLPLQVNTTITRRNFRQVDAIAELLAGEAIVLWSVFFLVPVGRGVAEERISPDEYEQVFERLWHHAGRQAYGIKTTEAPHYRRYVLMRRGDPQQQRGRPAERRMQRAPLGVSDGKGVMFVSHTGQIFPSGFLPIPCGRFPADSVVDVYQRSEMFQALRDPNRLQGKCGVCEFRHVCGGSRARAYAVTGDPLGEERDCVYVPRGAERVAL